MYCFGSAVWKASREVLPNVEMRGCAFHWGQAVWRHLQQFGLQTAYNTDTSFHSYCHQLLALPCLPWELIGITLKDMTFEATTDAQQQLCSYIRWIDSTVRPPASWSIFNRRIRSNNDVGGWHRRLNMKAASGQLNMYLLIELLASEAALVDI